MRVLITWTRRLMFGRRLAVMTASSRLSVDRLGRHELADVRVVPAASKKGVDEQ
jgi:hypothetical protein